MKKLYTILVAVFMALTISSAGYADEGMSDDAYYANNPDYRVSDSPYMRMADDMLDWPNIAPPEPFEAEGMEDPTAVEGYNLATGQTMQIPSDDATQQPVESDSTSAPPYQGVLPPGIILEPESVFPPDDRSRITAVTAYPWRTVVNVYITHPGGGTGGCSGALIDAYHVLTAGHCVYLHDEHGWPYDSWASSIRVVPGQNHDYMPYYQAWATYYRSYTGWTENRDHRHDWAVITLDRNVGNFVGWMGRITAGSGSSIYTQIANTAGYPCNFYHPTDCPYPKTPTETMWFDADYGRTASEYNHWYYMDTQGGQSGSPVWRYVDPDRYIMTVHAYGNDGSGSNHGTRLNEDKYDRIFTWLSSDTPPTDRADLIDDGQAYSGFSPTTVVRGTSSFNVWSDVRNVGTASSGGFYVSYYASTNTTITTFDCLIGTDYVSSISPFSWRDSSWSGTFPAHCGAGSYWVGWIIDSDGDVTEFNEGNNTAYKTSYKLTVIEPTPTPTRTPTVTPTPTITPTPTPTKTYTPTKTPTPKPVVQAECTHWTIRGPVPPMVEVAIICHLSDRGFDGRIFDWEILLRDQEPMWPRPEEWRCTAEDGVRPWTPNYDIAPNPKCKDETGDNPWRVSQCRDMHVLLSQDLYPERIQIHLTDMEQQNIGIMWSYEDKLPPEVCRPTPTPTQTPVPPPNRFFGDVTLDGSPAAPGTSVNGEIGGTACGSTTVQPGSTYVLDVPSAGTVPGCGVPGATVNFRVGGYLANETGSWTAGAFTPLDLSAGSTPTPTPTETPVVTPTDTPTPTPTEPPTEWNTIAVVPANSGAVGLGATFTVDLHVTDAQLAYTGVDAQLEWDAAGLEHVSDTAGTPPAGILIFPGMSVVGSEDPPGTEQVHGMGGLVSAAPAMTTGMFWSVELRCDVAAVYGLHLVSVSEDPTFGTATAATAGSPQPTLLEDGQVTCGCTPPFTPIVAGDSDCDAAPDIDEDGLDPFQCGDRDKNDPWDFYDVPAPSIHNGGDMNNRDSAVSILADILAVLEYTGTEDDGLPNSGGRDYDDDIDGDGYDDGLAYDRSVGATWSGPPDGAINILTDVLLVLDQSGTGPCPSA